MIKNSDWLPGKRIDQLVMAKAWARLMEREYISAFATKTAKANPAPGAHCFRLSFHKAAAKHAIPARQLTYCIF